MWIGPGGRRLLRQRERRGRHSRPQHRDCRGLTQRCRRGPPGPDTDLDKERRGLTQSVGPRHQRAPGPAPGPDTETAVQRRSPTQRERRPDIESVGRGLPGPDAGPSLTQGAPGPDTERRDPTRHRDCQSLTQRAPGCRGLCRGAAVLSQRSLCRRLCVGARVLCVGPRALQRAPGRERVTGPTQRLPESAGERRALGSDRAPGPDTESVGRAPPGPATERRAPTERERDTESDKERRGPTQRAPRPDTESAGPRHRASEPNTQSPAPRNRERWHRDHRSSTLVCECKPLTKTVCCFAFLLPFHV